MSKHNGHTNLQRPELRTAYLISAFILENLSEAEEKELNDWVNTSDENLRLFDSLTDTKTKKESLQFLESIQTEKYLQKSKQKLQFRKPKVIRLLSYAAAACFVVTLGIFVYIKVSDKDIEKPLAIQDDIQPGEETASLTLGNGKQVLLKRKNDTVLNGFIHVDANNGEVSYAAAPDAPVEYHTVSVPRKGSYTLLLPDKTIVYLNAASSIRFPTRFEGNERKVTVTGEAYFEVAKDKAKPFRVQTDDMLIEAVGTAFNVNAYADESYQATTLTEGKVKILANDKINFLSPGQELRVNGKDNRIYDVNTSIANAWVRNEFKFNNTSIQSIMRQVSRWYDADIIYKDDVDAALNATISRNVPVSKLLSLLSKTGEVHFSIEGRTIVVSH